MSVIKCNRCGEEFSGDKHGESGEFDQHVCKGLRNLNEMPMDILNKLARKQITEDEAWEKVDARP